MILPNEGNGHYTLFSSFGFSLNMVRRFNFKLIARLAGILLCILSCSMVLPVSVSVFNHDGSQFDLILSALAILLSGLFLRNVV